MRYLGWIGIGILSLGMMCLAILLVGNHMMKPRPTADDQMRINSLREKYGRQYNIEFEDVFAIEVRDRVRDSIAVEDAKQIFVDYWFENYQTRQLKSDSYFTSFKFYGKNGTFLYQLFYDPRVREIGINYLEHD